MLLRIVRVLAVALCTGTIGWAAGEKASPSGALVLDTGSFWRCHLTFRDPVVGQGHEAKTRPMGKNDFHWNSSFPPFNWMQPEFDDGSWWRVPGPFYGGYGFQQPDTIALISLRGKFAVEDPAKVKSLTFTAVYRGGLVVYLNGKEVKRASLPPALKPAGDEAGADAPQGQTDFDTLADPYPLEAYLTPDGKSIRWGWGDPGKYKDRCELRIRRLETVTLPTELLRPGLNVLAIEVHRAPYPDGALSTPNWWDGFRCHAGLLSAQLHADASERVIVPSVSRPKEFQVWNASPMMAIFDMDYGDPNNVLRPIRIPGARNGSFSGQVVVSCDEPVKGLKATVTDLTQEGGKETIGASAVQVRFAKPGGPENGAETRYGTTEANRFDALEEAPPAEVPVYAKTRGLKPCGAVQPVWVTVNVPSNAAAGEYKGTLTITAEGRKETTAPVVATVADWVLPDSREYVTFVDLIESPESVAMHYEVPFWSDKHWELVESTFRQLARVGTKTVYIPLICKTHFGNSESMVRWVKQPPAKGAGPAVEAPVGGQTSSTNAATTNAVALFLAQGGSYKGDFTILERYLDIAQKHLGKPEVVCFYVWEGWAGGGYFGGEGNAAKQSDIPVSLLKDDGSVETIMLPRFETPQAAKLWKPITDELRERMKKRGLEKSMMVGIGGDVRPHKAQVEFWKDMIPEAKWVSHSHAMCHNMGSVPVAYATTVWQAGFAPDPDNSRMYGWRRDPHPNKGKGQAFAQFNRDMVFGHLLTENRLLAERNITGNQVGFGRNGADFWPVFKNREGKMTGMLVNRYPESNWAQLSVKTCLLAPGPAGALSTVRWEMMVESVQECEARIFIEKVLLDKARRAQLGEEEAARLQAMLDERTRACEWGWQNAGWLVSSGWQERTARLYAAAAEVEKTLTTKDRLAQFKKTADDGKKDEAAAACRKFIRENGQYPSVQAAALARLVEILGDAAFDDLADALNKKPADARSPVVKTAASLKADGISEKWLAALKKAEPPARAGILETFVERADKAGLPAAKECLSDKDEAVRIAAATALARLSGKESIADLAGVLQTGGPAERDTAAAEIVRMPGDDTGAAIAEAISRAKPAARAALLGVLAKRDAKAQVDAVLAAAADKEESVRVAALKALNVLTEEKTLPAVVGLLTKAGTDGERQLAEMAAKSACERIKDPEKCFPPVNAALNGAPPPVQGALLRVLGRMAGPKALQVVQGAVKDKNADVQDAAIRVLGAWPTADAADGLLEIVRSSAKEPQKLVAHQGYSRLVVLPSERPAEQTLAMIKAGLETAFRPDEKKVLLSGLGKLKLLDALKTAETCFDDVAVQQEAGMAMVPIAEAVGGTNRTEATAALKKVIEKVRDKRPAQTALARIEMYDHYITAWKVAGPCTEGGKTVADLFDAVFPAENPEAKDVEWKPVQAETDPAKAWQTDLAKAAGGKDSIAYLRTTVESPAEQEAQIEMGSCGAIKVWLNGKEIHTKTANRAIKPGDDRVKVSLKAGANVLLIKVAPGKSGWAACARFRKPDGTGLEGLQIKAE